MASLEEVTKVMAFLGSLWPKEPVTKATIKAYHVILEDVDGTAVLQAAKKLGAESTFFPKAAEIRQTAFRLLEGAGLPEAAEGWHQLMTYWGGHRVEWHALTEETIHIMGGLRRLGDTLDKDLPFVRSQFMNTFETLRNRELERRRELPVVTEYKQLVEQNRVETELKRLAARMSEVNHG